MNCLLEASNWGSSLYYTSSVITQHLPDIYKSAQEEYLSWDQAVGSQLQDRIGGFSHSQKQTWLT